MSETSTSEAATVEPTVRVYNKGTRTFIHGKHNVTRGTFHNLPQSAAELLLKNYPDEILSAADASAQIGGANAALAEANAKLAKLEKDLAELKAGQLPTNVKALQKALKDLKDEHAELQEKHDALEEKATKPDSDAI